MELCDERKPRWVKVEVKKKGKKGRFAREGFFQGKKRQQRPESASENGEKIEGGSGGVSFREGNEQRLENAVLLQP